MTRSLDINSISLSFLKKFEAFILSEPKLRFSRKSGVVAQEGKKVKVSVISYMSSLKFMHRMAKDEFNDEENGVINIPLSPFAKYSIPRSNAPKPRAFTVE